jgi:hypothetical protein
MRRLIKTAAEHFAIRAGYGKGFWILIAGVLFVSLVLIGMENQRLSPQVERIPASEPITDVSIQNK